MAIFDKLDGGRLNNSCVGRTAAARGPGTNGHALCGNPNCHARKIAAYPIAFLHNRADTPLNALTLL